MGLSRAGPSGPRCRRRWVPAPGWPGGTPPSSGTRAGVLGRSSGPGEGGKLWAEVHAQGAGGSSAHQANHLFLPSGKLPRILFSGSSSPQNNPRHSQRRRIRSLGKRGGRGEKPRARTSASFSFFFSPRLPFMNNKYSTVARATRVSSVPPSSVIHGGAKRATSPPSKKKGAAAPSASAGKAEKKKQTAALPFHSAPNWGALPERASSPGAHAPARPRTRTRTHPHHAARQ